MKINYINMCKPSYVGLIGFLNFYIIPMIQLVEAKETWSLQFGLFYYVIDITWKKK